MKVLKVLICSVICSITFFACSSTKQQNYELGDSYSESMEGISIADKTQQTETETNNERKTIEVKKNKNLLQSLFTFGNKDDFIKGDEFTLFTKGAFSGIVQKEAEFMISVDDLNAGFGSPYLAAYYILTMNETSRKKFIASFNQYCSDFENKKLNRKGNKTIKAYGSIDVHLDWGTINTSTPNNADGKALLGYEFQNKSPYFTITIYPIHNNHYDVVGDSTSQESMSLKYYFTKSQATQLCSFLEQEIIEKTIEKVYEDEY